MLNALAQAFASAGLAVQRELPAEGPLGPDTALLVALLRQSEVVHVDETMCPSCKELLPYIGLELGNPTITFVNHKGRRLTMQDGKWLK